MIYLVFLALFVGGGLGFLAAWVMRGKDVEVEKQARAAEAHANEELKSELSKFDDRFKAIAGDVLRTHSKDFLDEFEKARKLYDQGLDSREKSFQQTVTTLGLSVESVKTKVSEFETQRAEQIGALGEGIKNILKAGEKMNDTAFSLTAVLSSASGVRGRWGETALRNLLEESGLNEGVDFLVQETIAGEAASLRPDVIINLPGHLQLAVDSKASLEEYFKAVEEKDPEVKKEHIIQLGQNLKAHIRALSSKEYQKHLDQKIPFVIMFVPSEAAIRAAFEQDAELYRDAQSKRVMLASPATIMPLMILIAHAWKQQKSAENAEKLVSEISTLGDRLRTFLGYVTGIGSALHTATTKFNQAASSWDARVSPQLDRISTLGGNLQIESEIPQIDIEPRLPSKALPSKEIE